MWWESDKSCQACPIGRTSTPLFLYLIWPQLNFSLPKWIPHNLSRRRHTNYSFLSHICSFFFQRAQKFVIFIPEFARTFVLHIARSLTNSADMLSRYSVPFIVTSYIRARFPLKNNNHSSSKIIPSWNTCFPSGNWSARLRQLIHLNSCPHIDRPMPLVK